MEILCLTLIILGPCLEGIVDNIRFKKSMEVSDKKAEKEIAYTMRMYEEYMKLKRMSR